MTAMTVKGMTASLSQNLTGSAPTLATDGQALDGMSAITVVIETAVPATQTLSGAGTLQCYTYDGTTGGPAAWSRQPDGDLSVTATGVARQAFAPVDVVTPRAGRVIWVPSSVTVSAGTTVTVYQLGQASTITKLGVY